MKKVLYSLLFTISCFSSSFSQSTNQNLVKTSEYVDNGKKRRDIYLDNEMRLLKEDYYSSKGQKIIFSIEYSGDKKIGKVTVFDNIQGVKIEIDYKKGTYEDFQKGISLKFKNNYKFDGIQKGEKIIVNYKDGIKDGRLVQADSAVTSHKTVAIQKVDVRYLPFDILKFYTALDEDPVFSLFNGLLLNFKNGRLNGSQSSFYVDGKVKFESNFDNDRLIKYTSFDKTNSIISKLETENGITNKGQILNGQLLSPDAQYIFWFNKLSETGDIATDNDYSYNSSIYENNTDRVSRDITEFIKDLKKDEENIPSIFEIKKRFDDMKCTFNDGTVMQLLLEIPRFYVKRFVFNNREDASIVSIELTNKENKLKEIIGDTTSLSDNYYFVKSPLPLYKYYTPEYFFYLQLPFSEKGVKYKRVNKEEEVRDINDIFTKWISATYNFSPSNFYLGVKPTAYESYEEYADSASLNSFLQHVVTTTKNNIQALENKTNLIEDPFKWQDTFYYYRYFYIWKTEPALIIQTKDGTDVIKIFDKHKMEAVTNGKKYCFEFDEQQFGKFKVVSAQIIDRTSDKILYEFKPKNEQD